MPVSTPHPRASGVAASKAARVRQRMPDSGCVGVQPVIDAMARRAAPTTIPRPPAPGCGGSSAIARSACPSNTGGTSGAVFTAVSPRSPSMNSRIRGCRSGASRIATTAAPVSIAAALPRLCECRTTTAPASRATCWVSSSEPSSTTSTRSTCGIARAERTVAAMRRDSSLAGMITATRWRALCAAALRSSAAALRASAAVRGRRPACGRVDVGAGSSRATVPPARRRPAGPCASRPPPYPSPRVRPREHRLWTPVSAA